MACFIIIHHYSNLCIIDGLYIYVLFMYSKYWSEMIPVSPVSLYPAKARSASKSTYLSSGCKPQLVNRRGQRCAKLLMETIKIIFLCFINAVLIYIYNQHWKLSFGLLWMPKQIWASTQYFTAAQEWPCRSMSSHASWHIYNLQLSTSKITSYLQ